MEAAWVGKFVLAIDTSADYCSVAIGGPSGCLHAYSRLAPREHSEILHPAIARALAAARWYPGEAAANLAGIAVTTGPGSYTGLRIGIAAAKGLAHAWGLQVAGIPTLSAMAEGARQGGPGLVAVAIAMRSKNCYAGLFGGEPVTQIGETITATPEAALEQVIRLAEGVGENGAVLLCGTPWRSLPALTLDNSRRARPLTLAPAGCDWPDPVVLAAMGVDALERGLGRDPADLEPQYTKPPAGDGLPAGRAC